MTSDNPLSLDDLDTTDASKAMEQLQQKARDIEAAARADERAQMERETMGDRESYWSGSRREGGQRITHPDLASFEQELQAKVIELRARGVRRLKDHGEVKEIYARHGR